MTALFDAPSRRITHVLAVPLLGKGRAAYGKTVSPNDKAAVQVRAVLAGVDTQLDIVRMFVDALSRSGVPAAVLAGLGAHVDQLQAASSALAVDPTLTGSVSQTTVAGTRRRG